MKSFLYLTLLLPLLKAGSTSTECAFKYTVRVVDAKNLPDEDTWLQGSDNDVYVEVYGYGEKGGVKSYKTTVKDNTATPEWNEDFIFDDEGSDTDIGKYEYFHFKLYDDDSVAGISNVGYTNSDFLGETDKFYASDVKDCVELFAKEMAVKRDDNEEGTLFVEISKENCDCSGEEEETTAAPKEKGSGGGKPKERRLLA